MANFIVAHGNAQDEVAQGNKTYRRFSPNSVLQQFSAIENFNEALITLSLFGCNSIIIRILICYPLEIISLYL